MQTSTNKYLVDEAILGAKTSDQPIKKAITTTDIFFASAEMKEGEEIYYQMLTRHSAFARWSKTAGGLLKTGDHLTCHIATILDNTKPAPCNCIAENIANGIEKYNWSKDFVLNGAGKHLADSDKIPLIGFAKPSHLPTNFVKSTYCPFCGQKYED